MPPCCAWVAKTEVSRPFQEGEVALSVHTVVWMSAAELKAYRGAGQMELVGPGCSTECRRRKMAAVGLPSQCEGPASHSVHPWYSNHQTTVCDQHLGGNQSTRHSAVPTQVTANACMRFDAWAKHSPGNSKKTNKKTPTYTYMYIAMFSLWVQEFENGVERDNLPCCAGHASFHVVQDMVGFLGFKHTLTAFHPPILCPSSPS